MGPRIFHPDPLFVFLQNQEENSEGNRSWHFCSSEHASRSSKMHSKYSSPFFFTFTFTSSPLFLSTTFSPPPPPHPQKKKKKRKEKNQIEPKSGTGFHHQELCTSGVLFYALHGGFWFVGQHYLKARQCKPKFQVFETREASTMVLRVKFTRPCEIL